MTPAARCLAAALLVLVAGPVSAQAERGATAEETRRVVERLTALGYGGITDVDVVGDRFEVDARSPSGADVDVLLDRQTLEIVSERRS
jgi:hypothetical protein